jgi:hypothetical protein
MSKSKKSDKNRKKNCYRRKRCGRICGSTIFVKKKIEELQKIYKNNTLFNEALEEIKENKMN